MAGRAVKYFYVEVVNQRYDEDGVAVGPFSRDRWDSFKQRLPQACRDFGTITTLEGRSFETGVGPSIDPPLACAILVEQFDGGGKVGPLLALKEEVRKLGGILRILEARETF